MSIKGKEVLIIEDVADQRMLARRILETVGMVVTEAESVDLAMRALQKKMPHLILLDIKMPVKSGFYFLENRHSIRGIETVPIIVTSGLQSQDLIFHAIALGAKDYLLKPFSSILLLQKVRKHLKDTVFAEYEFPSQVKNTVKMTTSAEITKISNTSFSVECAVRLGANVKIDLKGKIIDELNLNEHHFISDLNPPVRAISGLYSSKVNAVGLTGPFGSLKSLRKGKA